MPVMPSGLVSFIPGNQCAHMCVLLFSTLLIHICLQKFSCHVLVAVFYLAPSIKAIVSSSSHPEVRGTG